MSLQQAQEVTGGVLRGGNPVFAAVSTDTRNLQPGALFVALTGPNFDGNTFVGAAAEKGACAALVSEPVNTPLPTLQVDDTRIALGKLGAANRRLSAAKVIALTGSQGKTTVKEMTAAILAECGPVLSTQGNLNNDYGVPLTLLRLQVEHDYAVIEMGANAAGEIAYTTQLTQPDIAHITNIAATHLEGFGSLQGVATAKAEIWQGLVDGGTAVLNLDDANIVLAYSALMGEGTAVLNLDDENIPGGCSSRRAIRKITLSAAGRQDAHYALQSCSAQGLAGSALVLRTPQGSVHVTLALPGLHNAANALAAAALAMEAGAGPEEVARGLARMRSVKGRLMLKKGIHGAVVLDDTYNASPASFRAAIDVLVAQPGIRIVVAGDMGELGSGKEAAHTELGNYAREQGVEHFFATGALSRLAVAAFGAGGVHAADCAAVAAAVLPLLGEGVSVLVKGSRSAGMERVVTQITIQED